MTFQNLATRLLSLGGTRVVEVPEEDLEKLLTRGQVFSARGAVRMPGRTSACHENTARLYLANEDKVIIVTGWALSEDGLWRQHSWGLTLKGKVVETTLKRKLYFGFELTKEEKDDFIWCNA